MRTLSLFIALIVFWCLLSGETFDPRDADHPVNGQLLLGAFISATLVVVLSRRMRIVDEEGQPIRGLFGFLKYLPWLFWQIVLANIDMARVIWRPRLRIAPRYLRVRCDLRSALGRTTYANSITLTPGTVTIRVDENDLLVHALTEEAARDLEKGEMHRRIVAAEGSEQ